MHMINLLSLKLVVTMLSGIYEQYTYKTQVASAIAQGKRAHTYIWYDTFGSMDIAKRQWIISCHASKHQKFYCCF